MSIVVFTIVCLALFGPKVAGFADLSLVGGLLGFLLLARTREIRIGQEYVVVTALVALVLGYSIIAVLLTGVDDVQPFLRHFRSLLSTILLGLFFYNLSLLRAYSAAGLLRVLILVLLVNAATILLSVWKVELQAILAELYGFNKTVRPFRSFGLTAGYDSAGYLCVIGAILSSVWLYYQKSKFALFALLFFIAAAMFTSRSSMVLVFAVTAGFCLIYLASGRWALKAMSATYLAVGGFVAVVYVIPLIAATFGWGAVVLGDAEHTDSFASTDLAGWWGAMWGLPDDTLGVLFGTGAIVETSDVGYVKMIFMIGVFGFLPVVALYGYLFLVSSKMRLSAKRGDWAPGIESWVLLVTFQFTVVAQFLFNIKNLYFLTRGYYELLIILFFFLAGTYRANSRSTLGGRHYKAGESDESALIARSASTAGGNTR